MIACAIAGILSAHQIRQQRNPKIDSDHAQRMLVDAVCVLHPRRIRCVVYSAPQTANGDESCCSESHRRLKGHSEDIERLAMEMRTRGCSSRDIKDLFTADCGNMLLSRTATSEAGRWWGRSMRSSAAKT